MIKVYIRKHWDFNGFEMIFVRHDTMNRKMYVAKPVDFEWIETPEGSDIKATMRFDSSLSDELLKALAESLDQHGIKTDNDFKIKGLLEAKEEHLKDLRILVMAKVSIDKKNAVIK